MHCRIVTCVHLIEKTLSLGKKQKQQQQQQQQQQKKNHERLDLIDLSVDFF